MGLAGVHLILVSVWIGLVLAEVMIEAFVRNGQFREAIAVLHYWLDNLFEIPLLVAITVTGLILADRLEHIDTLHAVKITAGLITVGATGLAVRAVRHRKQAIGDPERMRQCQRQLELTGLAAVPAGLVAGVIGLTFAF